MNFFEILFLMITAIAGAAFLAAIGTNLDVKISLKAIEVKWSNRGKKA